MSTARTIQKSDLFRLQFVAGADLAPDGRRVAYSVSRIDPGADEESAAIWLVDLESGASRRLTNGIGYDGSPRWSPDGTQLGFLSTRGGTAQLHVIAVDGGEARPVTAFEGGVAGGPVWSPDGTRIAFTAVPPREMRPSGEPYRVDRFVYRFNGHEYLDDVVQDLYVLDLGGGEPRRLTDDRMMNLDPRWSPDGREILISSTMDADRSRVIYAHQRVVDVASGAVRELTQHWGDTSAAAWTPDGSRIVVVGHPTGTPGGGKSDVWIMDAAGGELRSRSAGFAVGVGGGLQVDMPVSFYEVPLRVSADGRYVYVSVQQGGKVGVTRVALDGPEDVVPVVGGERMCALLGLDDTRLLYVAGDINHPGDLYVSDLDGGEERRLTSVNEELLATVALPAVEHLRFPGTDGAEVEGWLLTPPTGQAPYPTVLYIHGGPHGAFGYGFHFDMQMLAGAGYAVLLINHRGSTGYGDAFATATRGGWGELDYGDLMAGVDLVIGTGRADADRLGVCGLSGGGNLTCWIVGHTDRFKAAVPENPVTSWLSFYGVSDVGVWFALEELGGHPWEMPEVYERC